MSIVIAGCGYVGSALARTLVARGERVIAIRRDASQLPEGVVAIGADLRDRAALDAALPGEVRQLVYAAAPDSSAPDAYRAAYVDGLRAVIEVTRARGATRAVLTSSTAVYPQVDGWVDEESATGAQGNPAALLEAEALVRRSFPEGIALRLAGIYGPGRDRIVRSVADGTARTPRAPRYGNRIHRDDCAGAIERLLALDAPGSVYVGVDDDPADFRDVYAWVAGELGVPVPALEDEGAVPARGGNKRCRNARLRGAGWAPRYPSFREGYRDAIERFRRA